MSRWTQDGAHIAAYSALAGGGIGALFAMQGVWAFAVLAVAGVLSAVALRALEAYDGHKQAVDALAKVTTLEARLEAVEKAAEEAKKQANAALTSSSSRPRSLGPSL